LTAKYFSRPLASFALVPNATTHPLTSNVMVLNSDGDLELYAIHDTPKQLAWSARGDLAVGAGLGLKVLEGYQEDEDDDEEAEFVPEESKQRKTSGDTNSRGRDTSRARVSVRGQSSRSPSASKRPTSVTRGRDRQGGARRDSHASQPGLTLPTIPSAGTSPVATPLLFGKDDDGSSTPGPSTISTTNRNTPSTATSSKPTGLSATRPHSSKHTRSEERPSVRSVQTKRSLSRTDTLPADDLDGSSKYDGKYPSTERALSKGRDELQAKSTSQSKDARVIRKKPKEAGVMGLIREDISMIIRRRAKAGYGLSQVG
jgi:hypothetical protein